MKGSRFWQIFALASMIGLLGLGAREAAAHDNLGCGIRVFGGTIVRDCSRVVVGSRGSVVVSPRVVVPTDPRVVVVPRIRTFADPGSKIIVKSKPIGSGVKTIIKQRPLHSDFGFVDRRAFFPGSKIIVKSKEVDSGTKVIIKQRPFHSGTTFVDPRTFGSGFGVRSFDRRAFIPGPGFTHSSPFVGIEPRRMRVSPPVIGPRGFVVDRGFSGRSFGGRGFGGRHWGR